MKAPSPRPCRPRVAAQARATDARGSAPGRALCRGGAAGQVLNRGLAPPAGPPGAGTRPPRTGPRFWPFLAQGGGPNTLKSTEAAE